MVITLFYYPESLPGLIEILSQGKVDNEREISLIEFLHKIIPKMY